jgi:hypothetical protein
MGGLLLLVLITHSISTAGTAGGLSAILRPRRYLTNQSEAIGENTIQFSTPHTIETPESY